MAGPSKMFERASSETRDDRNSNLGYQKTLAPLNRAGPSHDNLLTYLRLVSALLGAISLSRDRSKSGIGLDAHPGL
jgi:hypothetical protein